MSESNTPPNSGRHASVSIVIPAFNEETGIPNVLQQMKPLVDQYAFEVIVVNDGSEDNTAEVVKEYDWVKLINNPYNKGYGASIKSGVREAQGDWIMTLDADGQHPPEAMLSLLEHIDTYDMVIGARQSVEGREWIRLPGKMVLTGVANMLSGQDIPDVNSGLRIFKKNTFLLFNHIFPNGFSISTTLTLALICGGYNVKFTPFNHNPRTTGTSRVKQCRDGAITLLLIIRCVNLFNPLKFYAPISLFIFLVSSFFALFGVVVYRSFPSTSVVGVLTSVVLLLFGILADLISHTRRGPE